MARHRSSTSSATAASSSASATATTDDDQQATTTVISSGAAYTGAATRVANGPPTTGDGEVATTINPTLGGDSTADQATATESGAGITTGAFLGDGGPVQSASVPATTLPASIANAQNGGSGAGKVGLSQQKVVVIAAAAAAGVVVILVILVSVLLIRRRRRRRRESFELRTQNIRKSLQRSPTEDKLVGPSGAQYAISQPRLAISVHAPSDGGMSDSANEKSGGGLLVPGNDQRPDSALSALSWQRNYPQYEKYAQGGTSVVSTPTLRSNAAPRYPPQAPSAFYARPLPSPTHPGPTFGPEPSQSPSANQRARFVEASSAAAAASAPTLDRPVDPRDSRYSVASRYSQASMTSATNEPVPSLNGIGFANGRPASGAPVVHVGKTPSLHVPGGRYGPRR